MCLDCVDITNYGTIDDVAAAAGAAALYCNDAADDDVAVAAITVAVAVAVVANATVVAFVVVVIIIGIAIDVVDVAVAEVVMFLLNCKGKRATCATSGPCSFSRWICKKIQFSFGQFLQGVTANSFL